MSSLLINVIGTGAALCTITSFVPQIIKIIRERDASSVSLRMYALTVSAFSLWTIYGVMLGAWPLVAANSVSLTLTDTGPSPVCTMSSTAPSANPSTTVRPARPGATATAPASRCAWAAAGAMLR